MFEQELQIEQEAIVVQVVVTQRAADETDAVGGPARHETARQVVVEDDAVVAVESRPPLQATAMR